MSETDFEQETVQEKPSQQSSVKLALLEIRWYLRVHALLFIGLILSVGGLLSFDSGRYCDGSTSDHFACTNPSTYYDYNTLTTIAIVLGVCFIALWWLKQRDID